MIALRLLFLAINIINTIKKNIDFENLYQNYFYGKYFS